MNNTVASDSLKSHGLPINSLTLSCWEEGGNEWHKGTGSEPKMSSQLANGKKFKAFGLASRAAGWLAENAIQTQPVIPAALPAQCPAELAPHVARRIAARYEEWI